MPGPREKAVPHIAFSTRSDFCKSALQNARQATLEREIRKPLIL
jgi:hypothetical protein